MRDPDPDLLAKVQHEQLTQLARRLSWPAVGTTAICAVMALQIAQDVGDLAWAWVALEAALTLATLTASLWQRSPHGHDRSIRALLATTRATMMGQGLVLGSVCLLCTTLQEPAETLLALALVLSGMVALWSPTLALDWPTNLLFVTPVLGQAAGSLLLYGGPIGRGTSAGLVALAVSQLIQSRRAHSNDSEERLASHRIAAEAREAPHTVEALQRALARRTELLSSVAHEMRTPLHGVLGICEGLLRASGLPGSTAPKLQAIARSGEHLLRIVNDTLDLGRLDVTGVVLHCEVFDLHDALNDIQRMCEPIAANKGLPLEYESSLQRPYHVYSDPVRIRQIVLNLVANAIKFTDAAGNVRVHTCQSQRVDGISLLVQDSGAGIPLDKLESIFEPFTQLNDSHAQNDLGTGLGLTITREIVTAMGGTIRTTSSPGRGSAFIVELPLERVIVSLHQRSKSSGEKCKRLVGHVLIAEDDELTALLSTSTLEAAGLKVSHVNSGEGAVKLATTLEGRPDLVLMDCELLGSLDGMVAVRLIREFELHHGMRRLPIIAVTGRPDDDTRLVSESGMDEYLQKPFDGASLLELVSRHLGGPLDRG